MLSALSMSVTQIILNSNIMYYVTFTWFVDAIYLELLVENNKSVMISKVLSSQIHFILYIFLKCSK